jgi:hypothetical protein
VIATRRRSELATGSCGRRVDAGEIVLRLGDGRDKAAALELADGRLLLGDVQLAA